MQVTLNVKLVNSEFDQQLADKEHKGEESEDNIKYIWEDEFTVNGDVAQFKIRNNATFQLRGYLPDETEFSYEIPEMTICECTMEDGSVVQFPISKKLIKATEKIESKKKNSVTFIVLLKDKLEHVNPMDGTYILQEHFPKELIVK
jgi:hypothetical protein